MGFSLLKAQTTEWRVRQYSIPDGLSQTAVNCILQDSKGFIWVGTQDGLNKFDGYNFTIYKHQPTYTNTLSNGYIKSIIEDNNGNLWLGTRDGLNMFNPNTGRFTSYYYDPYNINSLSDNEIFNLYIDRQGILWVKTMRSLDRLDLQSGKINRFPHFSDVFTKISASDRYFPIFEDSRDMLWVGSKDGLFFFDRGIEQFRRFEHNPLNHNSLSNNKIKSIIEDTSGMLWIGTEDGLNRFDPRTFDFQRFYINPVRGSRSNNINSLFKDSDNNFWVATENGLFLFNYEEKSFVPFQTKSSHRPAFNMEVTAVMEDKSGIFWVGTLSGIFKVDSKAKFSTLRLSYFFADMPTSIDVIASVYYDDNDHLWVGTWGSGIFRINRTNSDIQEFSTRMALSNMRISDDFVHSIGKDKNGSIIIGTRDGVDVFDEKIGMFVSFCTLINQNACEIFVKNRVFKILSDSKGNYWFATQNGLHRFGNRTVESFYNIPNNENSLPSNIVRSIIEGSDGYFYIGTVEGLVRFDYYNGIFTRFQRKPGLETLTISNNEITDIHEDKAGNLWIGTISGLNLFYKNTETFIVFSEKNGLPNNFIYAIEEDKQGKIWVSTNRGLASVNPVTWEIARFDMADGLQNYEFNLGASFNDESGELFFGGISGLNYFFPEFIRINNHIPNVLITSVTKITPYGNVIYTGEYTDVIRLNPGEETFSIQFAALDFTRSENNNFAYKMEGIDKNWVYIGNRNFATFSKLPPGEYVFRIKGSNNDLVWNEVGASARIIVLAPFYKTKLAIVLYVFGFLFIGFISIRYWTRNLRKANQILKEKELAAIEIALQKEELSQKNRNITDSIHYAKRIQVALMPSERLLNKIFPESFIFYDPKDIVSGDFYWVNENKNKIFLSVIDCTGHGVPGAFMSIIGMELLRNIITVQGTENPAEILSKLNIDLSQIFSLGDKNDTRLRDGMDIGFCVIHKNSGLLEFGGAFSSMYVVRDNVIQEIKGDRFSVGLILDEEANGVFQTKELLLTKNDIIYMFTDGYADQFGGQDGRKYKYRRFRHLLLNLHSLPMPEQKQQIYENMKSWRGIHEQVDDMLIMAVKPCLGS